MLFTDYQQITHTPHNVYFNRIFIMLLILTASMTIWKIYRRADVAPWHGLKFEDILKGKAELLHYKNPRPLALKWHFPGILISHCQHIWSVSVWPHVDVNILWAYTLHSKNINKGKSIVLSTTNRKTNMLACVGTMWQNSKHNTSENFIEDDERERNTTTVLLIYIINVIFGGRMKMKNKHHSCYIGIRSILIEQTVTACNEPQNWSDPLKS